MNNETINYLRIIAVTDGDIERRKGEKERKEKDIHANLIQVRSWNVGGSAS